jgi:hypothetical protein
MTFVALHPRFVKRRPARKAPQVDAELVFKTFVRALERLREGPRAPLATTREKA